MLYEYVNMVFSTVREFFLLYAVRCTLFRLYRVLLVRILMTAPVLDSRSRCYRSLLAFGARSVMRERATDLTAAAALETTYAELRLWCGTPKATPFPRLPNTPTTDRILPSWGEEAG